MKMNRLSPGILLLALFFLCFTSTNAQQDRFDTFAAQAAQVTEFDVNGLKVIVKRRASSPTVAGGLFFRGGARNINAKNAGIEQLMLLTAVEAGKNMPRQTVRRELSRTGSGISAGSTKDFSVVSFGTTKQNFGRIWEILSGVMMEPAFNQDDLDRNREQILTGLRESSTLPEGALEDLLERSVYSGHPYANEVAGNAQTIGSITLSDIKAYHKNMMETSRLLLVIVGDLDIDDLKSKVASSFGKLPRGIYKNEPVASLTFSKNTVDTLQRTLPTTYIKGMFSAPPPGHKDYHAMRVAISILQSLVVEEVRMKRQLSYAPNAEMGEFGANTAYIEVSTGDPDQAVSVMLDQIKLIQQHSLRDDAIEGIAGYFLRRHFIGQETSGAQVGELARYELIGGGWKNAFEFLNGVRKVRGADVNRVANTYMKNIRFAVVGDAAKIKRSVFVPEK